MKRIFTLLILFSLSSSEKNNPGYTLVINKDEKLLKEITIIQNRHKPKGSDIWFGKINDEH